MDPGKIDPAHRFIPHLAHVEKAWSEKDAALAAAHAAGARDRRGERHAHVRVYAQWARGLALSTAGKNAGGLAAAETLDYAREKKAGLENEARLLSDLSSARLAIDMAARPRTLRRRPSRWRRNANSRAEECRAQYRRRRALGRMDEYDADRAEAARLMDETGARLFAQALKALEG